MSIKISRARLKMEMLHRQSDRCAVCGHDQDTLKRQHKSPNWHLHRLVPNRQGGKYIPGNVRVVCGECHIVVEGLDPEQVDLLHNPYYRFSDLQIASLAPEYSGIQNALSSFLKEEQTPYRASALSSTMTVDTADIVEEIVEEYEAGIEYIPPTSPTPTSPTPETDAFSPLQELRNSLLLGDSISLLSSLPSESVPLSLFSPNYDDLRDYGGGRLDLVALGEQLYRITVDGGFVVMVLSDQTRDFAKSGTTIKTAAKWMEMGWRLFETCIYHRTGNPGAWWSKRFRVDHEYILIFFKGKRPRAFDKEHLMVATKHAGKFFHGTDRQTDGSTKPLISKEIKDTKCRGTVWHYNSSNTEGNKLKLQHPACVDDQTECLTDKGWKTYQTLQSGDFVASPNIHTKKLEWKRVQEVIAYNHQDIAISVEGRHLSMMLNQIHRCVVTSTDPRQSQDWFIRQAVDLQKSDVIPCATTWEKDAHVIGADPEVGALLGWFLSEGNYKKHKNGKIYAFEITQSQTANPEKLLEIENLLNRLGVRYSKYSRLRGSQAYRDPNRKGEIATIYCSDKDLLGLLLGLCGPEKSIPECLLHWKESALITFLKAFVSGDGHTRPNGTFSIKQHNQNTLNMLQAIGVRLGYDCYLSKEHAYVEFTGKRHKHLRDAKQSLIQQVYYDGIMWCPVVEDNQTFVARRQGKIFFTGNTFPDLLAADIIRCFSLPKDIVLDPCMGSGTTCVMAARCGRYYIGMDCEPSYLEIARLRMAKESLTKPRLLDSEDLLSLDY